MPKTAIRILTHEERLTVRHLVSEKRKAQTPYVTEEGRHHGARGSKPVDRSRLYDRLTPLPPSIPARAAKSKRRTIHAAPSLVELIGRLANAV